MVEKKSIIYFFIGFLFCLQPIWAQDIQAIDVLEPVVLTGRTAEDTLPVFELDVLQLRRIYAEGLAGYLQFRLPLDSDTLAIRLQRIELLHPDFRLLRADGTAISLPTGRHYQGIQGDTLLALSVFPNGLHAQLHSSSGSYSLAADPRQSGCYYWRPAGDQASELAPFCQTPDTLDSELRRSMAQLGTTATLRGSLPPLSVYFEMDHYFYLEQNEDLEACLWYMLGAFNSVAQIYRLEGIGLQLRGLKVWDTPDVFSTESALKALNSFRAYLTEAYTLEERDWDAAMLLSRYTNEEGIAPLGGLASLNSLCNSARRQCYGNISSWYNTYPAYSWTVFVIAHELGHTLGSPHSHNCFWPEGPLDDCYCPEGSCAPGPSVAALGGGTIMSYCYLLDPFSSNCPEFPSGGNPGVNYLRAFSQYPGDLLRQRMQEKACLEERPAEVLPNLTMADLHQLSRINDTVFVRGLKIKNTGVQKAVASQVGVYQGADLVGTAVMGSLAGGDSTLLDFYVLLPDTNRRVDFTFQADMLQEVGEWHEGDNLYAAVLQEQQDYAVLSLETTPWRDADYFFWIPQLSLKNTGWADSAPTELRAYLAQAGRPLVLLTQKNVPSLSPEEGYTFSLAVYEPGLGIPPGDYSLRIELAGQDGVEVYHWPQPITIRGGFREWYRK